MYCNHCGEKLSGNASFCAQCGRPIKKHGSSSPTLPPLVDEPDTDMDKTKLISSEDIQRALREAEAEKESAKISRSTQADNEQSVLAPGAPKAEQPKEVRPAWLDEEDDPALYNRLAVETEDEGKETKPSFAAQMSVSWQSMKDKFEKNRALRQERKEQAAKEKTSQQKDQSESGAPKAPVLQKSDIPGALKTRTMERKPFFSPRKDRKAGLFSREETKDPTQELFISLYIGVVAVALVIGVVLGLFIIRPWANDEEEVVAAEAEAAAAIVWHAPMQPAGPWKV